MNAGGCVTSTPTSHRRMAVQAAPRSRIAPSSVRSKRRGALAGRVDGEACRRQAGDAAQAGRGRRHAHGLEATRRHPAQLVDQAGAASVLPPGGDLGGGRRPHGAGLGGLLDRGGRVSFHAIPRPRSSTRTSRTSPVWASTAAAFMAPSSVRWRVGVAPSTWRRKPAGRPGAFTAWPAAGACGRARGSGARRP